MYILLLPILVGSIRYKGLSKLQRILFWMIVFVAINQFVSKVWIYYEENNLPFFYSYIIIESLFLFRIYSLLISKKRANVIFALSTFFVGGYWLIEVCAPHSIWTYPSVLRAVESATVVVLVFLYFRNIFVEQQVLDLEKRFTFWMGAGLIVYFTSSIVLYLFSEHIVKMNVAANRSIWIVHAILTILLYISFSISLLCKEEKTI